MLALLSYVLGGAVLANAVPHFVSGMMGEPFQTPFARPRGEGLSSSTTNVLWGLLNLAIGWLLICRVGDFDLKDGADAAALGLGMAALAVPLARHFGRFNGGNAPERR